MSCGAPQGQGGVIHATTKLIHQPSQENLSDDLRAVSTWWQWSPDDLAAFKAWARQHHDAAAEWVHAEAQRVRDLRDVLRVASVNDFIRPNADRAETETPLQSSVRKSSCL